MRFFIGSIQVDASTGVARVDDTVLPLGKKVVATLAALYAQAGDVVPKATLLRAAWADSPVDDSSLWQTIHVLRGALDRYAPDVRIETVKGRGYCLKLSPVAAPLASVATQSLIAVEAQDSKRVGSRWFWPAAATLLCAVAINGMFEHRVHARRTIILITTNDSGKLPPLPPLPASE